MYKVFVGGLPFSTTDDELREAFAAHGAVASANVVRDRESGRSKGFGFVQMGTDEEAQKAIAAWASSSVPISTKPKPLLRPVSRSLMICAETTVP